MNLNKIQKIFVLSLLLVTSMITPAVVTAQAQKETTPKESITLSPAVSKPNADAGTTKSSKLTVINDGQTDYQFLLYARPFSVNNESYDPNYTTVNKQTEAYQWIQFSQTKVTLKAGTRADIPYTLKVPKDASGGGHYAVLFAETQPSKDDGSQIERKKRVGTLVYLTVNGEIKESGSVQSFDTKLLQTKKPVTSDLRLKNDGNVHFQATSKVSYKNIFGKSLFNLNQEQLVLPGTTRRIPIDWQNAPVLGIYKVQGSVEFLNKSEVLPTKYILLIPVQFTVAVGVVLILVALYIISKRLKRKPSKSKAKTNKHGRNN